jgi:hypothetical protein
VPPNWRGKARSGATVDDEWRIRVTIEDSIPERYFYHSFPRRGASAADEIDKGCKVLAAIRDLGLLLMPQLIEWQQPSAGGAPPRTVPILQKRVCFTELGPGELPAHAERFGHFALEFDVDVVRGLGAVPVFYIPQPSATGVDGSAIATAVLTIAADCWAVVQRIASLDRIFRGALPVAKKLKTEFGFASSPNGRGKYTIDRDEAKNFIAAIGHGVTPWSDLENGAFGLLNFFHPTDNAKADRALEYYREREWRVATGFALNRPDGSRIEVMHVPTASERARFLEIDPEFFGRTIKRDVGDVQTLDAALVYPGLGGKRIIEMVRRVIVPGVAIDRVTEILSELPSAPAVVGIETLVS